jgi:hemoglobin
MRRLAPSLALLLALAIPAVADSHQEKTLYQRLGGYDALAAVTDDFIGRMAGDGTLAPFFAGHSKDSLARIRQLVVDQLCAATGGPCVYTGRDMVTSHRGMGITEAHWNAAAAHLIATLDKFEVPEKEKGEVLALVATLKDQIVDAPAPAAHHHR